VNVLLVYAHPESRSLNGSIRDFMVDRLVRAGHVVEVSDLYAMGWKASLDADDFPQRDAMQPFSPSADSRRAYTEGTQTADVAAEQDKLRRASRTSRRLLVRLRLQPRGGVGSCTLSTYLSVT